MSRWKSCRGCSQTSSAAGRCPTGCASQGAGPTLLRLNACAVKSPPSWSCSFDRPLRLSLRAKTQRILLWTICPPMLSSVFCQRIHLHDKLQGRACRLRYTCRSLRQRASQARERGQAADYQAGREHLQAPQARTDDPHPGVPLGRVAERGRPRQQRGGSAFSHHGRSRRRYSVLGLGPWAPN